MPRAAARDGGILLDGRFGQEALTRPPATACGSAGRSSCRARARCASRAAPDLGCSLREWPAEHCVKCLVFYHPDDPPSCAPSRSGRC